MEPLQVGRYVLLEHLASGGSGEVYAAASIGQQGLHKPFAVKIFHRSLARDTGFADRFHQASNLALSHSHPNVVAVDETGCVDGRYLWAMELVDGRDLERLIGICWRRRRPLPIPAALHVAEQVLVALDYWHQRIEDRSIQAGFREIGSTHVLLSHEGNVKLTGLGAALEAEIVEGEDPVRPRYASPERLRGEAVDHRAELFSVAVLLWELLTCERFAEEREPAKLLERYAKRLSAGVSTIRAAVPPRVDRVLERALALDPADRYPTVRDLCQALKRTLVDLDPAYGPWELRDFMRSMFDETKLQRQLEEALKEWAPAHGPPPTVTRSLFGVRPQRERRRKGGTPEQRKVGQGVDGVDQGGNGVGQGGNGVGQKRNGVGPELNPPAPKRKRSFSEEMAAPTVIGPGKGEREELPLVAAAVPTMTEAIHGAPTQRPAGKGPPPVPREAGEVQTASRGGEGGSPPPGETRIPSSIYRLDATGKIQRIRLIRGKS